MTVESASFISQLDATYPASGDAKSEGDNHLRLIKTAIKATFPNLTAAAVTPTTTELNYVDGVTSAIQTQLDAKAPLANPALTGVPTAPTAAPSTSTTQIATTAFVQDVVSAFPYGQVPLLTASAFESLRVNATSDDVEWALPLREFAYANRADLRSTEAGMCLVATLGLFAWESGSVVPDDDDTCFATTSGRWLLRASAPEREAAILAAKILQTTFSMALTSVGASYSYSQNVTVTGASVGNSVIVTPGNLIGAGGDLTLAARIHFSAFVASANTVTVTIKNATASTTSVTPSTWSLTVIKH